MSIFQHYIPFSRGERSRSVASKRICREPSVVTSLGLPLSDADCFDLASLKFRECFSTASVWSLEMFVSVVIYKVLK